jgi:hypothetical protein
VYIPANVNVFAALLASLQKNSPFRFIQKGPFSIILKLLPDH